MGVQKPCKHESRGKKFHEESIARRSWTGQCDDLKEMVNGCCRGYEKPMDSPRPIKPLVLFDGACGFCNRSMERWKRAGEGRLDFESVQNGAGFPYGFPPDRPMGALHLVETTGEIRRGAGAVFRMMDLCGNVFGHLAWMLYARIWLFRVIADRGYAMVSERRVALSVLTCALPRMARKP